eukprot:768766-Hanusia_phi.AAC.16
MRHFTRTTAPVVIPHQDPPLRHCHPSHPRPDLPPPRARLSEKDDSRTTPGPPPGPSPLGSGGSRSPRACAELWGCCDKYPHHLHPLNASALPGPGLFLTPVPTPRTPPLSFAAPESLLT